MTLDPFSGQIADQNLNVPPVTKVLFVDSRVPDLQSIIAAAEPGVKIVVLDANQDGVQQMASALNGLHNLESIGVVSHGDEGVLLLGNGPLFAGNIAAHQADLSAIGAALGPDGDILLYGCDVGRGDAGSQFIVALTTATGADVAASSNSTGDTARDGDWNLEITAGQIDGAPLLDAQALTGYHYVLHTASVSTVAQLKAAILTGNTDGSADTITLTSNITFASTVDAISINVTDGQTMSIVGGGFTLSGANLTRVLNVNTSGAGSKVSIDNLTISNGFLTGNGGNAPGSNAGGDALGAGIYNAGTLTITNSTITANKAAGGGGGGGATAAFYVGGGGGGGGFGSGVGGNGGTSIATGGPATYQATTGTPGVGGHGGGGGPITYAGKGGSTTGGAGGNTGSAYYTAAGNGATADNGSISIGGGGGGVGYDATGGRGGNAASAIYNTGTLVITGSTITNNIAAGGGGGGGGSSATFGAAGNGGAGGAGIAGIWNAGGTANLDSSTNTSLSTGNTGAGAAGGIATRVGSINGAAGAAISTISTTSGGTTNTNYVPPPTVTSATYDASTGVLSVTGSNITNGGTIDVSKFSLTGQGGNYTLTSANVTASSGTAFTVTLSAADKMAVNGVLNNNGTTSASGAITFNLAAAANWDVTASAAADSTGNAVTVSNVTMPMLSSATYDANTGTLIVTGTNLVKAVGSNNDITANKISVRAEANVTYVLTDTADVEITSATSFTLNLSATDKAALNQIVNKDGTDPTSATSPYLIKGADDWNTVITGGDIKDIVNNWVTVSNVAVPAITSATYNATTGNLVVTGTGFTHLNNGGPDDIIANKFTITGEGGSTYTLTNTANVDITSGTAFTLVLSATDKSGVNQIINKSSTSSTGGSTYNLAAAEDWAAGADALVVVADLNGNGISATVAAPTVTSATYDASTGTLVVTGTGFTHRAGATNDIIANKFTLTGQGGSIYGLTDTANVETTSDTSFTLVLSATDKAGLRTLINNNGTQSVGGTTYNLEAADDWANGADAALNIADLTGNGITVSNVVSPAITSATYDASTGILSVTGTNLANGDTIDVSKLSITGQAGSYTLTTPNVTATSATAFAITLNAADKLAVNGVLNNNGTSAVDTTTFNLAAATGWDTTVNTTADLTGNAITVSNVTAPTITSATYDGTTHVFTVTGTNLVKTIGATNDITISALTITGEGGATRTLSTTGNVEVTSATSFTFTLAGADIAAVDALLNKNGTASASSSTTYNLAVADDWGSVITGGNIQDLTGNGITVSNAAPSILSATYDAATGILSVSAVNIVGGDTIDVSKLSITGQAGSYTLTTANVTASSSTAFAVTLNAADKLAINGILNNNGTSAVDTTTFNLAAAASWNATTTSSADLTGNAITVSNVTAPTITSATYDGTTHVFTVTGTNLVKTIGATNDITISNLTITGEGGATRTLSTTGNVEVTSATSFTFTLAGADIAAVDALLNKNGTASASSSTTYNLAVADDWGSVITGGNIQDLTGNGITVSNAAPSILSATYDAATGILSVSAANIVGGDTIDVSKLSLTGQAGSYTLTTANVTASSATAFSVTLNAADKLAINGILNNNGTSAVDTTTFNLAAAASWDQTTVSSADLTGNAVTVSNVTAPTITSATYDGTSNVIIVTGTNLVKTIGATNDLTISALTITGEGGATRTLSTTGNVEITSDTSFTFTLAGADIAAVSALLNKNGTSSVSATTYNIAAADDWNSVITGGNIQDLTGNGISVSNVPVPTITSATYDVATGSLVIAGTGFLKLSGATNDIVGNKFTLTGEGGASYTLTDTASVEITNGTAATLTLSSTDKAAINLLINKNGAASTSGTTYNLAAAEDWAAGADPAVVVADTVGNGVTVSNLAAPQITSATYSTQTSVLTVTGTNFIKLNGVANDIDISKLKFTGQGAGTYTLTSANDIEITSATSFSVTLSGADKTAIDALLNKTGTSANDNTAYNLAALEDWAVGADPALNIADETGNSITATVNQLPVITSNSGGTTAAVSISENSTMVTTVQATDPDTADTVAYSIAGGADGGKFNISASTGVLSFITAPNYEAPSDNGSNNTYEVIVKADDGRQGSDTQTLTVSVTNLQPSISNNGTINVAENTTGVAMIRATAGEPGSTLSYSIAGGADASLFAIDATTGALNFIVAPNFEVPSDADTNNTYDVQVQASDSQGGSDRRNLSVTVTNANDLPTGSVAINGIAAQGGTLTASNDLADIDGPNPLSVSYQWQANGTDITGATGASLTLAQAQVGQTITVVASYTDALSNLTRISSNATAAVANINDAPTGSVVITGTATQGQTLTASNDLTDGDGPNPLTINYQWQANGADITGATGANLILGQDQVGKTITVFARYTDAFGSAESKTSSATPSVANTNDAPTGSVSITGTPTQGQTLTVTHTLSDSDGPNPLTGISYQWFAGSVAITGATTSTLLLSQAQAGQAITVLASYTDAFGQTESISSLPTATVDDNDGVSEDKEDQTPGLPTEDGQIPVPGDGNGDGTADSQQSDVTSVGFIESPTAVSAPGTAPVTFVSLVADSLAGEVDTTDNNSATLSNVRQLDAPAELPANVELPLGLIAFEATVGNGPQAGVGLTETFSLFVDTSLGLDSYWKQDNAGNWVNLASSVTIQGSKTRIDFSITDGGAFDSDQTVNGVIVDPGAAGSAQRPVFDLHDQVLALYIAYYDRAPDAAGLQYWENQAKAGMSLNEISAGFAAHPRFAQEYGGLNETQIAAKIYQNVLHRAGDTAGIAYWANEMKVKPLSEVMTTFVLSAMMVDLEGALSAGSLTAGEYALAYERQKVLDNLMLASEQFLSLFGNATNPTAAADVLAQDAAYQAAISVLNHVDHVTNAVFDQRDQMLVLVGQADAMQQVVTILG